MFAVKGSNEAEHHKTYHIMVVDLFIKGFNNAVKANTPMLGSS